MPACWPWCSIPNCLRRARPRSSRPEVAAALPGRSIRGAAASLLGDTLRMIRRVHPRRGTPRVQSQDRLRALHAEVSTQYLRLEAPGLETTRLPSATPARDSQRSSRCARCATWSRRARPRTIVSPPMPPASSNGTCLSIRVLKPQRATLSIVRSPAGDWEVDQLETRSNGPASPLTHRLVAAWLDEHALSA